MRDRRAIFAVLFVVLAAVIVIVEWRSRSVGPSPEVVDEVLSDPFFTLVSAGINKDGLPSIDAPKFISVAEADAFLDDDRQGIALSRGGESRFYPYQILVWHEVVNDTVGGEPVLVTYCALCDSGIVYARTVNGRTLMFGVSGQVWNANTVLYDRETDSRWTQLFGEALSGELAGAGLTQLPSQVMTWKEWKQTHRNGKVLSKDTGSARDYTRNPYFGYENERRVLFPLDARDDRLHPKEFVYGYIGPEGERKAYPLQYLVEEGTLTDSVGGRKVTITYDEREGVTATGENLAGETVEVLLKPTYWYVWYAFFPETELYDPIGDAERAKKAEEQAAGAETPT